VGQNIKDVQESLEYMGISSSVHGLIIPNCRVGIVMGSDSDLPTMVAAAEILQQFAVNYEIKIVSAHRTPSRMYSYAQSASERGLQVIIAGAGGAAHLPGMIAALTPLPVIGVPIFTSTMNGQDSLLSIVQMPRGIPVATVAIGNATNAGLLAVRILGATDSDLLKKMEDYMLKQETEVLKKADKLEIGGYKSYLESFIIKKH
jgi:phosphoribosylaminoimidazole carboxylase